MNRYTITYYTKAGRIIVSPEIISNLDKEKFVKDILKDIEEKIAFVMEIEKEYEVILTNNIESFKVTQY